MNAPLMGVTPSQKAQHQRTRPANNPQHIRQQFVNMASLRRLQKELKDLTEKPPANCSGGPKDGDVCKWQAAIVGPDGTPFSGGCFMLDLNFPTDYPFKPPTIEFKTKMYHPNINEKGQVCLPMLKESWSPALTSSKILEALTDLLKTPNIDSPLTPEVATQYKTDPEKYEATVREYVTKYAQ